MVQVNAAKSDSFKVGGDIEINRLGFGAMRITPAPAFGALRPTAMKRSAR